jgi:hypothetical protein
LKEVPINPDSAEGQMGTVSKLSETKSSVQKLLFKGSIKEANILHIKEEETQQPRLVE